MYTYTPFPFSYLSLQAVEPPGAVGVPVAELVHDLEGHHLAGLVVDGPFHPARASRRGINIALAY